MKLVVGLGNPGKEYTLTKHNVGFLVIDELGNRVGTDITKSKFQSLYGEGFLEGNKILLLKPQTYMNRSGGAVFSASDFYKIPSENIIVVHDEMDISLGRIMIRPGGGSAAREGGFFSSWRRKRETVEPNRAGVSAMPKPRPPVPPVTTAIRPLRSKGDFALMLFSLSLACSASIRP